jgi:hypothetical protein
MTLTGASRTSVALDVASTLPLSEAGERRGREFSTPSLPLVRRRRRRPEKPFHLVIVDHDNDRYTLEGPMTDAEAWIREVVAARKAGRLITCRVLVMGAEEIEAWAAQREDGTRWPSGFIVAPPELAKAAPALETPDGPNGSTPRLEGALEVTSVMVLEALRSLHRSNQLKDEALGASEATVKTPAITSRERRAAAMVGGDLSAAAIRR